MKMYFVGLVLSALFLFPNSFFPQTFKTSPYITLPGNNTDVDVVYGNGNNSFICWINQSDSIYTLFLKYASPDSTKNIIVFSDTAQIASPNISTISSSNKVSVRIAWQSYVNNHWQILSRELINDSLTNVISISDSLEDNTNPVLNEAIVAWIQNGNLIYKYLNLINEKPIIIDSADCSNPGLIKLSNTYPEMLYEKGPTGNKQIIEAYYSYTSSWVYNTITNTGNNINPRFGRIEGPISYQAFVNGVWKSVYQLIGTDTTDNISYNCQNPESFAYLILAKKSILYTPYFVVYDSDSLKNNKEIIMKAVAFSNSTTNLSNAAGDDYLPQISLFESHDTLYVAIFWIHDENGKKDIWMAYSKFSAPSGVTDDPGNMTNSFILNQNYPNPFNPSTTISWQLEKSSAVTLKIYDVLGNEITTLVNEYQNAGKHSITFDTQQALKHNLSSGIYFYQLKAGSNITAKKMLYLK